MPRRSAITLLAGAAALALAACGQDDSEATYEAGVEDAGGGELIVTDADQPGVAVELPETPMTPVPVESAGPSATVTTPPTAPLPEASATAAD